MFAQLADNGHAVKQKIDVFIALAPVVYLDNTNMSILKKMARFERPVHNLLKILDLHELNMKPHSLMKIFCRVFKDVCNPLYDLIYGKSRYHDQGAKDIIRHKGFWQVSIKQVMHFAQILKRRNFVYFNSNRQINLDNIPRDFPIVLMAGVQDELSTITDIDRLH